MESAEKSPSKLIVNEAEDQTNQPSVEQEVANQTDGQQQQEQMNVDEPSSSSTAAAQPASSANPQGLVSGQSGVQPPPQSPQLPMEVAYHQQPGPDFGPPPYAPYPHYGMPFQQPPYRGYPPYPAPYGYPGGYPQQPYAYPPPPPYPVPPPSAQQGPGHSVEQIPPADLPAAREPAQPRGRPDNRPEPEEGERSPTPERSPSPEEEEQRMRSAWTYVENGRFDPIVPLKAYLAAAVGERWATDDRPRAAALLGPMAAAGFTFRQHGPGEQMEIATPTLLETTPRSQLLPNGRDVYSSFLRDHAMRLGHPNWPLVRVGREFVPIELIWIKGPREYRLASPPPRRQQPAVGRRRFPGQTFRQQQQQPFRPQQQQQVRHQQEEFDEPPARQQQQPRVLPRPREAEEPPRQQQPARRQPRENEGGPSAAAEVLPGPPPRAVAQLNQGEADVRLFNLLWFENEAIGSCRLRY